MAKTNMTLVHRKVISLSIYNAKVCTLLIHWYLCFNVIYFFFLYSLLVVEPHLMWIEVNVAGNLWIFYHIYASCIFHKSPQKKNVFLELRHEHVNKNVWVCVWVSNKFPTFHQILRSLGKVNTQNKPHLWVIVFVCINLLAPLCNLNESKSLIHYSTHVLRPQVSSLFFQNFLLCKIVLWPSYSVNKHLRMKGSGQRFVNKMNSTDLIC